QAFPDLSGEEIDLAVRSYLDGGRYSVLVFPFDPPPPPVVEEHLMSDADVHATRALLFASARHLPLREAAPPRDLLARRARIEADEALRGDGAHVLAQ